MTAPVGAVKYPVQVQDDHIERISNSKSIPAVAELVWNALDADAKKVEIELVYDELGMKSVIIRDNGHGIPHTEARDLFTNLGGSWKAGGQKSKTLGRMLHGKAGQGRFKALALGRVADWFVNCSTGNDHHNYQVRIIKDRIKEIQLTPPQHAKSGASGVTVIISELWHHWQSLEGDSAVQAISEILALYLTDYPEITVSLQGKKVDPALAIHDRTTIPLSDIDDGEDTYPVRMDIIEWKSKSDRVLYLCEQNGFPLSRFGSRFHVEGFYFSAYLKSSFIGKLNRENMLELGEMNQSLRKACEEARKAINTHFLNRASERAQSLINQWKEEDVYPFEGEPGTSVESVERKVFDIVAVSVSDHLPDFSSLEKKTKAFHLRMLKQGIEKSPEDVQVIISEVLQLPKKKQKELADLLQETTLSAIISASKLVADRIKFLDGLETILFDRDMKRHLKERSQLHKLLERNTWIFGEEFNLTVSDKGLTEVLRAHAKLIGGEIQIDDPVRRVDGSKGIIDLMLSRKVRRNRTNEIEHLVVELKAPTVTIGSSELMQAKSYASAVAKDPRFSGANARWTFWAISNSLDDEAKDLVRQDKRPDGLFWESKAEDNPKITIWAMEWAHVIRESRARHEFFREALEHDVDKGASLQYLQQTYDTFLKGVILEETTDENIGVE